jgi:glycosyltransferase involved in cell wall biosynthesis
MRKTDMIWNMVDSDLFRPASSRRDAHGGLQIGTVARLTRWKAQHIALQAADLLNSQAFGFHWYFAGDASMGENEYARQLYEQVNSLQLEKRVAFLGWQEDTSCLYRSLDVLVHLPVEPEPFGLVIAEALSSGLPIIATHGGLDEVVKEAGGVVIPAGDGNKAMHAILSMAEQIQMHSDVYRERARSVALKYFAPNEIIPQWLSLYDQIAA